METDHQNSKLQIQTKIYMNDIGMQCIRRTQIQSHANEWTPNS